VLHYLQRTALQGHPTTLSHMTDHWMPGAARHLDEVHPFQKWFEDLEIGDAVLTPKRTVTLEDIDRFAESTGDKFYAHMDEAAASASPFFKGRVAHGYLVVALAAGLFVDPRPGPLLANIGMDNLRFSAPTYPGDSLQVAMTCRQKSERPGTGYGEVRWDITVTNQDDRVAAQYDLLTLVACRAGGQVPTARASTT
jgi:oxepin-CoA hydrolase/3-oxo-5,6-dehydrosuberyl-CoA semialdehyde dehydrogenase